jgi:hypothetical protein
LTKARDGDRGELPRELQEMIDAARAYRDALAPPESESRPVEAPREIRERLLAAWTAVERAMGPAIGPAAVTSRAAWSAVALDHSLEILARAVRLFAAAWAGEGVSEFASDAVVVSLYNWECRNAPRMPEVVDTARAGAKPDDPRKEPGEQPIRLRHNFELTHDEVRAVRAFDDLTDRLALELLEVWGRRLRHRSSETSW